MKEVFWTGQSRAYQIIPEVLKLEPTLESARVLVDCWAQSQASSSVLTFTYLFVFGCAGLCCWVQVSLVAESWSYSEAVVCGLLRFQSCCMWPQLLLHGMWDRPGPGIKTVCSAWQGRFLTTGLPRKPQPPISDLYAWGGKRPERVYLELVNSQKTVDAWGTTLKESSM